jgi:hypothetical protein
MRRPLHHMFGALALLSLLLMGIAPTQASSMRSFLSTLAAVPLISVSTVAPNGDQNPYGVAVVPRGFPSGGTIKPGEILVSNFNNSTNLQGTGTTIVAITPTGHVTTFFTAPPVLAPVGLTTALVALRSGLVVVGNTPTTDGTPATISNGSLIFLDQHGQVVLNLTDSALLQGPWDMTADDTDPDEPILYVSNVLNGTVTRIDLHVTTVNHHPIPTVESLTLLGSGFMHRTDPNALVVGPTGLLLGPDRQTLYIADTGNNRIQVLHGVRDAKSDLGAGQTVVSGPPLKGPLALAWSPFGTIIASNGDATGNPATPPNMVVEFDPATHSFVATRQLDTGPFGAIFGITIARISGKFALIYVDDNSATLNILPSF